MRLLTLVCFLAITKVTSGQTIQVSIFNSLPLKSVTISVTSGKYLVASEFEKLFVLTSGKVLYASIFDNQIMLQNENGPVGSYEKISITTMESSTGSLRVTPINPKIAPRSYPGDMILYMDYGKLILLNETEIEPYIAGVVEAESGPNASPEFYKAQALLCRTYIYSHLKRHETEGFTLCDEVHCQAYKGITANTPEIYKATFSTRNMVIVAKDSSLITAVFHGNCGGETAPAENAWIKDKEYLRPVKDPYCQSRPNANWEKTIPLNDWKLYLQKKGFPEKSLKPQSMEAKSTGRKAFYKVLNDSIPTSQIRTDWQLKSSFFQLSVNKNEVILKGHGYGHGVGLCQDGAMKMAESGKKCEEIIKFYFKGVEIKSISETPYAIPAK